MARVATCYVLGAAEVVNLSQLGAKFILGMVCDALESHSMITVRFVVVHIDDFFPGSQEFFRLAMAVQAPFHLQRVLLIHERHLVHGTMTTGAPYTFIYMNAVVEVDEVREIVDARPLD